MKALAALLCAAAAIPMAAAAQPSHLQSSAVLEEDHARDSWTYRNPSANIGQYKSFFIAPTVVYDDPSAKWGGTTPAQRSAFAEMLTRDLREEMGKSYTLASSPGPGVATMRLTLLSVAATVPGVATATRVTPVGLALNGVKSLAGKPGSFSGSAQIAFELTDSTSHDLLIAAIRRRSPDALDISASLSTENTIAAVSKDVAEAVRKAMDKAKAG
jgi:hypothetical protein